MQFSKLYGPAMHYIMLGIWACDMLHDMLGVKDIVTDLSAKTPKNE